MSQSPTDPGFPVQLPLENKEQYQYARNFLAWCFQNHGNERLIMFVLDVVIPQTTKQRKGIHVWFELIAQETGHSAREIKDYFMSEYFTEERVVLFGKEVTQRRSFADLDKKQVNYLMECIDAWCAERSIRLDRRL